MLGLVLHQLVEALVPRRCRIPQEAKSVEFSGSFLRQLALPQALIIHPYTQRSLTHKYVAVTVLRLILRQLVQALFPRQWYTTSGSPAEANIIKFLDAIRKQLALPVHCTLPAHPFSQRSLTLRNVAVAVVGLVLRQLIEALVPRRWCASRAPVEAKIVEFLDALLGQFALLLRCALMGHPIAQRSLTLRNVAVTALGLVLRKLVEAFVPCVFVPRAPVEAKRVKFSGAILGQFALPVREALTVHPITQRSLSCWNVAVAVLCLEGLQLAALRIPCLILPNTLPLGFCPPRTLTSFDHPQKAEVGRSGACGLRSALCVCFRSARARHLGVSFYVTL